MSKETKKFMRKVRKGLDKVIGMHLSACGHEGPLQVAYYAEDRLLDFIEDKVDRLEEEIMEIERNRGPG